uniref:ATP synthase complex subunit 8 n=1 Tax=Tenebrionoidea sp. 16 KM-2017 TaxID=2219471 RepID=A0A346RHL6_9CUCU|nr:ATP synthase F0 subunit 8 [Tenebrionoidea sp. 16 KM-2017]
MPQMAPLNWLTLMLYFILIFFLFNSVNYYSFLYEKKTSSKKKSHVTFNWKW